MSFHTYLAHGAFSRLLHPLFATCCMIKMKAYKVCYLVTNHDLIEANRAFHFLSRIGSHWKHLYLLFCQSGSSFTSILGITPSISKSVEVIDPLFSIKVHNIPLIILSSLIIMWSLFL